MTSLPRPISFLLIAPILLGVAIAILALAGFVTALDFIEWLKLKLRKSGLTQRRTYE